ncbi:DNA-binding response regulator, OmpR family, contains REC and winged-helix (wHTH) domain [Streptomyces sp. cf386]|uniref:response regulator transcription factor n=1 Tax=Streptomyces sp. cf386 TaxID=1761904 RepID=UPI0008899113|nr:response regulator transcription factor [Streptomyces sp. cf386]SDP28888.1 DNA-binding response regulator, OmpR family, contains REC and winged-helix (wHTH) domain [Streptomyces sp. cf386]
MSPRQTAPPVGGALRSARSAPRPAAVPAHDNPALQRAALARGAGQHILIVAGEPDLAELLSTTLELAGYRISLSRTGAEALARVAEHHFDLVVFDTTLPDMAHFGRERRPTLPYRPPVLLLTEYDALHRLVPALGPGERDYVTKPFRVAEVLTRIQVLLRGTRPGPPRSNPLQYGDLALDDTVCRATRGTRALDLTPAEYRLLRHLLVNAHRVLSKEQIGRYVWGDHRGDNAIEQLVSRLRRKVDRDGPALIHTRRGFGYWLGRVDIDS